MRQFKNVTRDKAITIAVLSGKTLQECSDKFGITKERIRQIVATYSRVAWEISTNSDGWVEFLHFHGRGVKQLRKHKNKLIALVRNCSYR